ncbi:MAG: MutS-related protein, partial [Candidatus Dojkabacteria bacterium]
ETAEILKHASTSSLVLFDEVGRGTSTFDGMSIAWAICEFLTEKKVTTFFATHYHELTELARKFPHVKNWRVDVVEYNGEVIFTHKIHSGKADKSYGIHVAKLAGLPASVLTNARRVLRLLEKEKNALQPRSQALFSPLEDEDTAEENRDAHKQLLENIKNMPIQSLSPIEAWHKIQEWQRKLSETG